MLNIVSRIIIEDSWVMLYIEASLTDDSKGIIFYCNGFIKQATGVTILQKPFYFVTDKKVK